MKKYNILKNTSSGFSLAEVLITLGVIGVVAALAIPTIIIHINTTKFRTQFKRTLSTLSQAVKSSEAKYDLNFASISVPCAAGSSDNPADIHSFCSIINGTMASASFYTQEQIVTMGVRGEYSPAGTGISGSSKNYYLFADGSLVGFDSGISSCSLGTGESFTSLDSKCYGFIDVNGTTAPNKAVECSNKANTQISNEIGNCIVRNNSVDMGDIFPIVFHDGIVEPLTNASRYTLYQSILNTKN